VERIAVTFHLYYAASIDRYIADRDGGVAWLDPYPNGVVQLAYAR
jgi:hypothetical protein